MVICRVPVIELWPAKGKLTMLFLLYRESFKFLIAFDFSEGGIMVVDKEVVKSALEPLEESFASDGSKIEISSIEGNTVNIKIVVFPGGCRECILPADYLEEMFKNNIEEEAEEEVQVHVEIEDHSKEH
jgi:Fe-S cluster biogenesis protein NfuA